MSKNRQPRPPSHYRREKSLQRLTLKSLDGYLLHTPEYMYSEEVVEGLRRAKDAGLVKHFGVSIYEVADALHALDIGMSYIQVPYNVLDQRLSTTDFFSRAKAQGATVFARSPFLQGLLVMEPAHIPERLSHARPYVEQFQAIASKAGLTPAAAALRFSLARSKAERIVFGVETLAQLKENVAAVIAAEDESWMADIEHSFRAAEATIVNPSLWSKASI